MSYYSKFNVLLIDEKDTFVVREGMDLYCYLPRMYFDKEHPFSLNEDWFPITVGNTYKRVIDKEEIAKNISKALYNQLGPYNASINEFINSLISSKAIDVSTKILTTSHLIGEYKVIFTINEGNDKTLAYHKVYCSNKKNPDIKIMFYQTINGAPSDKFAAYNNLEFNGN